MAGARRIRISENDKKEYARLVRNTKAKINRTNKNYGIDLSGEVDIVALEDFETREDFNLFKETLSSFTNRFNTKFQFVKSDYGVVMSKAEVNEMTRVNKIAQRRAREESERVADLPYYTGGEQSDMTVGMREAMLDKPITGINIPADFDYRKIRQRSDFERMLENRQERTNESYYDWRQELMLENYIQMVERAFNSDADELVEVLKKMPPDDFYAMYLLFDSFDFDEYYLPDGVEGEEDSAIHEMLSDIELYYRDGLAKDLKSF